MRVNGKSIERKNVPIIWCEPFRTYGYICLFLTDYIISIGI